MAAPAQRQSAPLPRQATAPAARLPPPAADPRYAPANPPPPTSAQLPLAARALEKDKHHRAAAAVAWPPAPNGSAHVTDATRAYPLQPHEIPPHSHPQHTRQHAPQQPNFDFQRAQLLSAQHGQYQANGVAMLPAQGYPIPPTGPYNQIFDVISKATNMGPQQQMMPNNVDKGINPSMPQQHHQQVTDERLLMSQQQQDQRHYQQMPQHYQHQQVQAHQPHQLQAPHPQQTHRAMATAQQQEQLYRMHQFEKDPQSQSQYQALRNEQDMNSRFQQQGFQMQPPQQPQQADPLAAQNQQALSHLPDHVATQQNLYQAMQAQPQQASNQQMLLRQMHQQQTQQQQHHPIPDPQLDHTYGLPIPAQDPAALRKAPADLLAWEQSAAAASAATNAAASAAHPRDTQPEPTTGALIPQNTFPPAQLFDMGLPDMRQPPPIPSHPMQQNQPPHPMQQMAAQPAQQTNLHGTQQAAPVAQPRTRAPPARQQQPAAPRQATQAPQGTQRAGPRQAVQVAQSTAPATHRPPHKNTQRSVKKEEAQMTANGRTQPAQQASTQRSGSNVHASRQQRPPSAAVARSTSAPVNGNAVAPPYAAPNATASASVSAGSSAARGSGQAPTQLPLAGAVANSALGAQQPYRKHPRSLPQNGADTTPRKRRHIEPPPTTKAATGSFPCQYCGQMFDMKRNRDIHVRSFHERSYPCDKCSALFKTKSDANRHMRIVHDRVRPFGCSECTATFAERGKLRRHKQTVHEKLRPYQCQICHAQFGERGNLNQHQTSRHAGMVNNTAANRAT